MRRLLILPALVLASQARASEPGDKAPELKVGMVLRGRPVSLEKGLHVVGFFAPQYAPSVASLPKVVELSRKYRGKVDFTEVAVGQDGDEALGGIKRFVAAAPSSDVNFALDGETKALATNYLQAFGPVAPPASFLVKDGIVQWVGHPAEGLDEAIDQTLKGKFDLERSKASFDRFTAEAREAGRKAAELQELMKPFAEAMQSGDLDGALSVLDSVESKRPDAKKDLAELRFKLFLSADRSVAELAKRDLDEYKDDAIMLNQLAWAIVDPEMSWPHPDYATALLLAKAAALKSEMKDGSILDTYALALYRTGDKKGAVENQTKAVDLAKTDKDVDPQTLKEMQDRLAMYKKDVV